MLDAGYSIEFVDSWGKTPLLQALSSNSVAVAKRLMERGANIHATAPAGNAVYFAVCGENIGKFKIYQIYFYIYFLLFGA